jgi:hypothetical protein
MANEVHSNSTSMQYRSKLPPASRKGLLNRTLKPRYMKTAYRIATIRYAYSLKVASSNSEIELPEAVKGGLRRYAVTFARITILDGLVEALLSLLTISGTLVALTVTGVELSRALRVPDALIVALIGMMGSLVVTLPISLIVPRRVENAITLVIGAALYGGAVYILDPSLKQPWHSLLHSSSAKNERVIAYALLMGASLVTIFIIAIIYISIVEDLTIGRLRRQYPNVALLDSLLRARRALAAHPVCMSDPSYKSYIAGILEEVAKGIETTLPKAVPLTHSFTRSEFRQRCNQAAAELRLMQMRLALSNENTLVELQRETYDFISAIATGDYGVMPAADLPMDRKSRRILSVIKNIIVAFIPIVSIIIIRYVGVRFSSAFGNWVVVVALIWAIISILSILDPLYKSKISDLRDVASIVRWKDQ